MKIKAYLFLNFSQKAIDLFLKYGIILWAKKQYKNEKNYKDTEKMKKTHSKAARLLEEIFTLSFGTTFVTLCIYFFKFPNNFVTGGVSGISVILGALFPDFSTGLTMMIINLSLLLFGFIFVGKDFGIKTVYCTVLLSVETYVLEFIVPMDGSFTGDVLLDLTFSVILYAVGSAILFNRGATTGGTEVIAMIIKKYSSINISSALMISDALIMMLTIPIFGVATWLYSCLGFLATFLVVNNVLESINTSKYITVISDKGEIIADYITKTIKKGATVSGSYHGAFTGEKKFVVLTVLSRAQTIKLKRYVKELDPDAFVIISNTSDIIGKGFNELV